MKQYPVVLAALELNAESDRRVLDTVKMLHAQGSEVFLIHAVEHTSSYGLAYGVSAGVDVESILMEEAKDMMKKVGESLKVPVSHRLVLLGPAKFVILDEAARLDVNLIVVGSHGRHGVRLLLGSTANAILHGAKCDVLAVRLPNELT
ncbi:MAG: universal stress protein UspA [Gammaproteobacteria bacterium RIFCSPHIGHO2_12_FULL_45_9]|nr:MAG: universal stress protein UspA [Gammaproteobacteria bacterium RIFCSPHIGHO2_12_FULL_45_9]